MFSLRGYFGFQVSTSDGVEQLLHAILSVFDFQETSSVSFLDVSQLMWEQRDVILRMTHADGGSRLVEEIELGIAVLKVLKLQAGISLVSRKSEGLSQSVFVRIAKLWSDWEAQRKAEEAEKEQLYKFSKKKTSVDDSFPLFLDAFDDLHRTEEETQVDQSDAKQSTKQFTTAMRAEIVKLHKDLANSEVADERIQDVASVVYGLMNNVCTNLRGAFG